MLVSIIIPTQRRPEGLETAVRSVLAQTGIEPAGVELIVADNDASPSAKGLTARLAKHSPFPVVYVHEPRAGVAFVRNAAVAKAKGAWIAFLDDDQEAPAGWLAALLATQQRLDADIVFGPVKARAPHAPAPHRPYLEWFFSREGPAGEQVLDHYYGCGDSLLRRACLPDQPFSMERNFIGGEDDLLFGRLQRSGARFGWAPDAFVYEDPIPDRQRLGYALRRAFAYGQGPTEHCASQTPPDRLGVARWMAIGLAQATLFGGLAGLQWLTRAPGRAQTLDRAARGLGKALWWGPFKIQFYGRAAG